MRGCVLATAVGMSDDPDEFDLFDALASLVDKSLVPMEAAGDTLRYRMLVSTRARARKKLDGQANRKSAHSGISAISAFDSSRSPHSKSRKTACKGPRHVLNDCLNETTTVFAMNVKRSAKNCHGIISS